MDFVTALMIITVNRAKQKENHLMNILVEQNIKVRI